MHLGKDKQAISLALFLLLSISAHGQAGKLYKYQLNDTLQGINVQSGYNSLTINYSLPAIDINNFQTPEGTFYRLTIPGHIHSVDTGKPELPVYCRLIAIPAGADISVSVTNVRTTTINPAGDNISGLLYPAQEDEIKTIQQGKQSFAFDRKVYASNGFLEHDTVEIEKLGLVRNTGLANIHIYPVRYDPHNNKLSVINSMTVKVTFSTGTVSAAKSLSSSSVLFNESLTAGSSEYNVNDLIPGFTDQPVGMIILTDSLFKKQLKPFIRWKTQKGFRITTLYKGKGLAGDTYQELKDTLTAIYNSSTPDNPPPEYLLIIGDINHVPFYGTGGTGNITDMYYGEFTGDGDYIPEMYVGRLPVADTIQLNNVVKKLIQYEKFDFSPTNKFYNNALVFAGYDADHAIYMNGQISYAVSNYLIPANNINEYHFNYPDSYTKKDSVIKLINDGLSFINYTGHGDETGWLHINDGNPSHSAGITSSDVSSLTNQGMYPFIISNACRTAKFSLATSFGNTMVVSSNKGAIGFIGCSNDSYWDEDYFWSLGTGTVTETPDYESTGPGAYDRLFHTHDELPSEWYFTMGQVVYAGNLAVSASNSARKKYYWETYNLIGDPSVIPIIGNPGKFSTNIPDTLPNGITTYTLNVDPFAYVAVSHADTLCDAAFSSISGTVTLKMPGLSNDSCLFVITGQNKIPLIKTVRLDETAGEFLNLESTAINDADGNNNNAADFGEPVFLKLGISNPGNSDATGTYIKISSTSNLISISSDSAYIGTIASGSEIINNNKLAFAVATDIPDLEIVPVDLLIKSQGSEKHYTLDITLHSPRLQIVNYTIDDSLLGNNNGIADPGETFIMVFRVRNFGSSDISGQLNLISDNINFTILEPSVKSGVIKFGDITSIPVIAKISDNATTGSYISFTSNLDCTPYIITSDFTFRVGKIRESFESESFKVFPWINNSNKPWTVIESGSYDGNFAARSGSIGNDAVSSLVMRVFYSEADSLRFFYKVSSEQNYDFLTFRLNGIDVFRASGEIAWKSKTIAIPAGLNKFEWIYSKDNSQSAGFDCAWLDMIDFAGSGSVNYIKNDLEVARIVSPVQKERFGYEVVTAKILNLGADTTNGFNLAYTINNQTLPVDEFFNLNLPPSGDSVTVTFK
ncbi:MAG TPA: C25 family cysteine peptidase, partial [Bacteroidales bacterium]|nr:C25 family cysteine peptidase [Bacteroidales bacterium]